MSEINEEVQGHGIRPVDAPHIYASSVHASATSNEFTFVFSKPRPVISLPTGAIVSDVMVEATGILSLSPQTAKDMFLLLNEAILNFETLFGPINSSFSLENEKKRPEKHPA